MEGGCSYFTDPLKSLTGVTLLPSSTPSWKNSHAPAKTPFLSSCLGSSGMLQPRRPTNGGAAQTRMSELQPKEVIESPSEIQRSAAAILRDPLLIHPDLPKTSSAGIPNFTTQQTSKEMQLSCLPSPSTSRLKRTAHEATHANTLSSNESCSIAHVFLSHATMWQVVLCGSHGQYHSLEGQLRAAEGRRRHWHHDMKVK